MFGLGVGMGQADPSPALKLDQKTLPKLGPVRARAQSESYTFIEGWAWAYLGPT